MPVSLDLPIIFESVRPSHIKFNFIVGNFLVRSGRHLASRRGEEKMEEIACSRALSSKSCSVTPEQ